MDSEPDVELPPCSIGHFNKSKCHLTRFTSKKGLKSLQEFQADEQKLLILRSTQNLQLESTVCYHHEAVLLSRFEFLQTKCCNPFLKENHIVKKCLRAMDEAGAERLKNLVKKPFLPGQKLCPSCRVEINKLTHLLSSESSDAADHDKTMETNEEVNTSLGTSPLKVQRVSKRDSKGYVKRKICQVQSGICSQTAVSSGFGPEEFAEQTDKKQCQNCVDFNELLSELKQKMQISSKAEKLQMLTLVPKSWSIARVASEFSVSTRMVKTSRKLKQEMGILGMPNKKKGKTLSDEIKNRVFAFFEDEEFSRLCPSKISVRIEGEKVQKQKRLLLSSLKEMHMAYRNLHGDEVSFSKFCALRPKWCITVGSASMH